MARTKLVHGQGTIMQDRYGRWIGRYYDGYTPNGSKRRREISGTSHDDVARKLRNIQKDRIAGKTTSSLDVKRWSDQYLDIQRATRRPATVTTTEWALKKIRPTIGTVKLAAITPAHIRKVTKGIEGDASRVRVHSVLIAMLRAAVREGHDVPAPALATTPPKARRSDRADIPLPHTLAILEAASKRDDAARWLLPFMCGLRQGETLGLTWDRVDLEAGTIRVDRQLQEAPWGHGIDCGCPRTVKAPRCPERRLQVPDGYDYEVVQDRFILAPVKTSAGERVIPLVPVARDALAARADRTGLVFQRPGGGPQRKTWDDDDWHALQEAAGVKHATGRWYGIHEARHTVATLLMALQVPMPVIQSIVGHSSLLSTATYLHSDQTMARAALDSVAAQLTT